MTLAEAIRNCEENIEEDAAPKVNDKVICRHCKKVYDILYLELTGITRCEYCHYQIKTRFYDMVMESRGLLRSQKEERKKQFGQKLKFYRKTNRYTTAEIAKILGISQAVVSTYERGVSTPAKEMQEIIFKKFGIEF